MQSLPMLFLILGLTYQLSAHSKVQGLGMKIPELGPNPWHTQQYLWSWWEDEDSAGTYLMQVIVMIAWWRIMMESDLIGSPSITPWGEEETHSRKLQRYGHYPAGTQIYSLPYALFQWSLQPSSGWCKDWKLCGQWFKDIALWEVHLLQD